MTWKTVEAVARVTKRHSIVGEWCLTVLNFLDNSLSFEHWSWMYLRNSTGITWQVLHSIRNSWEESDRPELRCSRFGLLSYVTDCFISPFVLPRLKQPQGRVAGGSLAPALSLLLHLCLSSNLLVGNCLSNILPYHFVWFFPAPQFTGASWTEAFNAVLGFVRRNLESRRDIKIFETLLKEAMWNHSLFRVSKPHNIRKETWKAQQLHLCYSSCKCLNVTWCLSHHGLSTALIPGFALYHSFLLTFALQSWSLPPSWTYT